MKPKILTTIKTYDLSQFWSDLIAGITVAMVAIPLSLAIAIASGADPAKGIVTAIIGGLFISLLGGSRVQIGGPTGAFIVVVYSVIAQHGYDGLVLATFMAGIMLMIAGYFRAGNLISLVPDAVINGFTIGIAIIIATSQVKDLLGLQVEHVPAEFLDKVSVLWGVRDTFDFMAFIIGLITIGIILLFRKISVKIPGLILAMIATSVFVGIYSVPVDTIASRFGSLPNSLPVPSIPAISFDRIMDLLPSAFTIAFLAGVESLLSALVADKMCGGKHRPNAEVFAQGVANLGSSLFGGMPATGAIARTATNVRAGGKTPVAGIIHALSILLAMIFAAQYAGYLVMPALAALLMLTAWNMSEPHKWKGYLNLPASDKILLCLTLVLTVVADLTIAIGVGIALGLAFRMRKYEVPPAKWRTPKR